MWNWLDSSTLDPSSPSFPSLSLPQDVESPDGAGPSSATPPDSQMMITTQPPSPSQVMVTTQPPSPVRVEQPPPPQAPPPQESLSRLQKKVVTLQQALDQAEQQRELINSEYRRLLGEKEVAHGYVVGGYVSHEQVTRVPGGYVGGTGY